MSLDLKPYALEPLISANMQNYIMIYSLLRDVTGQSMHLQGYIILFVLGFVLHKVQLFGLKTKISIDTGVVANLIYKL